VTEAEWVKVTPECVGGKERHIGQVSHSVAGISDDQRLPRWLWPSGAGSAHHSRYGWRSRRATTRSATAPNSIQETVVRRRSAVAKATRSVSLGRAGYVIRD